MSPSDQRRCASGTDVCSWEKVLSSAALTPVGDRAVGKEAWSKPFLRLNLSKEVLVSFLFLFSFAVCESFSLPNA